MKPILIYVSINKNDENNTIKNKRCESHRLSPSRRLIWQRHLWATLDTTDACNRWCRILICIQGSVSFSVTLEEELNGSTLFSCSSRLTREQWKGESNAERKDLLQFTSCTQIIRLLTCSVNIHFNFDCSNHTFQSELVAPHQTPLRTLLIYIHYLQLISYCRCNVNTHTLADACLSEQ